MWAYCDTSAIVKRYVRESGSATIMHVLHRYDSVSSAVLTVEIRSALRRRASDGSIEPALLPTLFERVTSDRAYWTLVPVDADVLNAAETIASAHAVRTIDAIHVASAQVFAARLGATLTFVSADRRQLAAAAAVGFATMHIA